ncbi:MAG: hypothetical protein H6Q55_2364, partial [Deltaproteobacteria bacterium]|nr:hypothetical protein [Deltaproteobacteria bacterium]
VLVRAIVRAIVEAIVNDDSGSGPNSGE